MIHPGMEHSFLLYPNFNQIFQETSQANDNSIKKRFSFIISHINKAVYIWFCFFFIIISKFFNDCNEICGIISDVRLYIYFSGFILFLTKKGQQVNMKCALQMRLFIHVFLPSLASYRAEKCFEQWMEFSCHMYLFIREESIPQ